MVQLRRIDRLFYICIFIYVHISCKAQDNSEGITNQEYNFYIVDTIKIDTPVLIYNSDRSSMFISNNLSRLNSIKIKKELKDGNLYIYGDDIYRYMESTYMMDKYNYPDYGGCNFLNEKKTKSISYRKFKNPPQKFILALINGAYYDKKNTVYGKKKSVFKNYHNSFFRIVFPICNDVGNR